MNKRNIIEINEDKCVGCGKCVNACVGGALDLIDGKAKLMRQDYCDGLGVCIDECPYGAITFSEVEVSANAPTTHTSEPKPAPAAERITSGCPSAMPKTFAKTPPKGGCPGKAQQVFTKPASHTGCPGKASKTFTEATNKDINGGASALGAWPIQLHLIRPESEQFQNADILIAASCSAFSCGSFHPRFLDGKGLVIACPKLDKLEGYAEKLEDFFLNANAKSITIVRMEVPCCSGLTNLVTTARAAAGSTQPVTEVTISLQGDIISEVTV